jgi:signal peptidase I
MRGSWDEWGREPGPLPPRRKGEMFFRGLRAVREILETIVPAIIIALLINLFMAQATRVYGQSMEPNLHTDQRLIVEKVSYHIHPPRRGDVVVLKLPAEHSELLIKRVIGLPGEVIEIKDGHVYINGTSLDEPYLNQFTRGLVAPLQVPPLHVFVLGDNRGFSNDSRSFGMIGFEDVVGRAWFSYWPLDVFGPVR